MQSTFMQAVSAADIDDLGHVNNARFLDYLERGREHWYTRTGVAGVLFEALPDAGAGLPPVAAPEGPRLGTVVVNVDVDFRRELFVDDRITITTRPLRRRNTAYVLSQAIRTEGGALACLAEVTCVVMDLVTRRTVPLPDVLGRLFAGAPGAPLTSPA